MIIKGGIVYYAGRFDNLDIAVKDGTILSVAENLNGDDIFDASGLVIVPGFVNTHTHNAMTLLRGAGDDMPLHDWLSKRIWPLEGNLTAKDCYWGNMLGIIEMIRTGTTCFNDMYFFLESTIKAVKESGIRSCISYGMLDFGDEDKAHNEMKAADKYRKLCEKESMVSYMMGPHAPYSCSAGFLQEIKSYADRHGLKIHIHLSETKKEADDIFSQHKMSPTKYLDSLSLLDNNTLLAHCVHMDKEDIALLASRESHVLHCPHSNLKLSSGIAPVPSMLEASVNVTLGTDGASSNNNLDMHSEMKTMALLHKLQEPTLVPAESAFKIATENGGKALGLPIGQIKEGYYADLVFIDSNHYSMTPRHNILSNLVYSLSPESIQHVMINGKFVLKNNSITLFDELKVQKKAQEHALALVEKL